MKDNRPKFCNILIQDALELGATDLDLILSDHQEVPGSVFQSASLVRLRLQKCVIIMNNTPLFDNLSCLTLSHVTTSDVSVHWILSRCLLIEQLHIYSCKGVFQIDLSGMRKLVNLTLDFDDANCAVGFFVSHVSKGPEFRFLSTLKLTLVKLNIKFFEEFSFKFPFMQVLFLESFESSCEHATISSHSLKDVSFLYGDLKMIHLNFPNIVKFVFKATGYDIPLLSFAATASSEWACDLFLSLNVDADSSFFLLRKLLAKVTTSKINLNLNLSAKCHVSVDTTPCFPMVVVYNLVVDCDCPIFYTVDPSIFRALFGSFRPLFVTENKPSWWSPTADPFLELLFDCLIKNDGRVLLYSIYHLEETKLELFEETLNEWRTIPSEKVRNAPSIPRAGKLILFRFTWRESNPTTNTQAVKKAKTESIQGSCASGRRYGREHGAGGVSYRDSNNYGNSYGNRDISDDQRTSNEHDAGKPFEWRCGYGRPSDGFSNGDSKEGDFDSPRRPFDRRNGTGHRSYMRGEESGNRDISADQRTSDDRDAGEPFERRGGNGRPRGGFSNGDREGDFDRPRRPFDQRNGTGRRSDMRREGSRQGNRGTQSDELAPMAEETVNKSEKNLNLNAKKHSREEAVGDKEAHKTEAEEKKPEDKEMTLEKYKKVMGGKRKAQSLQTEGRKIDVKEFEAMHQLSKKARNDDIFVKLGPEKDKKTEFVEKEERAKKSVSINKFLKPADEERKYSGGVAGGQGRGEPRGGSCGGGSEKSNVRAPAIGGPGQFPT